MENIMNTLDKYKKNNIDNSLMKSFNDSLKDEKFKKLVSKLNLPYEKLCNNTTELEECSNQYDCCLNCKGLVECPNKMCGYAYLPEVKNGKLIFGYKMCKYKTKNIKDNKYLENVYSYDIPATIKTAQMKDIYKKDENRFETITWLSDFYEKYLINNKEKGLFLYGSFGSGKTYLIAALFNELAKHSIKSAIVFWPEYLMDLKSSFGKDDYQEKINKIKKVPLLLIDDIGAENTTAWGRDEVLCPILQYRMTENLTTFFTSNLDKEALEQHFSSSKDGSEIIKARRIMERINQLTFSLEMVSKNLRK